MNQNRFLFLLALILFSHTFQAQLIMIDIETGEYNYKEVVKVDSISQVQIHDRAKEWLSSYYKPSIDSIIDNTVDVRKTATNSFSFKFLKKKIDMNIFFDVEIKAKENRYRYEFSNFKIGKETPTGIDAMDLSVYINRFPIKYQDLIEEPIDKEITNAISRLAHYISNGKVEGNEDDNW